ncbi:CoA:oxalate CoA-transferase [Alkalispirochaeta americana]|uniref:CoA:oxalate CoA-transferase n=1 Tax=Alkalispirochaeta americana TaxID=159291 RepID=A0A1N6SYU1_9SPIO|nr:CoA transferase [Alkalispirochaeta americana]SIQ46263.1 CoA:oxalate CoA-transferase [Alkalispirochaeta americana]
MKRVLEGLRVVSFGLVISAPSAARMLCDLGAEVIKIEPHQGDTMRMIRPVKKDNRGKLQSGIFTALNCGEKSMALDLRTEEGQEIARKLILEWADVVIANFKPGTLAKFGIDYETIRNLKPGIIYGEISGYGQKGPWAQRGAYDICVQSECGIAAQNGPWGEKPHRVGFSVLDYLSGRDLVIGILGALHYRERTGQGQHVDISLYNSGVTVLEDAIPGYDMEGVIAGTVGSRHPSASPHNLYKTRDGYINIIAINNFLWKKLVTIMGRPDLEKAEGLSTGLERLENMDRIDEIIEEWTSRHTTDEIAEMMDAAGLPRGKLCTVKDVIESEQTRFWNMAPRIEQPFLGEVRINNCPIKYSEAETDIKGPAPILGEHNRDVVCDVLGYDPETFDQMKSRGVFADDL